MVLPLDKPLDFEKHLQVAMEFLDFAFTPAKERELREQEKLAQQLRIEGEMSQIERTLGIIRNRVPTPALEEPLSHTLNVQSELASPEVTDSDVQRALQATQEHIAQINLLLQNL